MNTAIQLIDICRQYQLGNTEVRALNKINLEIDQGEFVALVGPSGSGKSTLLNLLGGLDKPTSGEIIVQGLALQEASEKELTAHRRHNVGFIFQTFNLIPTLTALENVALPPMLSGVPSTERQARAQELLSRVGLEHRLDHRPTEMSGGEQQRAAIARALVNDPNIILADEPTGNLDTSTGSDVMRLLRDLNVERGVTLIIVTHDPEVAAYADRIVHLRDGEIIEVEDTGVKPRKTGIKSSSQISSELSLKKGISLRDLSRTAVEDLRRRPIRNILTAAGVLIGIVTLVAMVSFGVGVQNEVNRNFRTLGLENVFVSPTFPESEDVFDPFGITQPDQPLTPEIAEQFREMSIVQSVTPILNLPSNIEISLSHGENSIPIRLSGGFGNDGPGPGGPDFLSPPEMLAGSPLGEGDTEGLVLLNGLADQIIAGSDLAYEDLIAETVTLTVRLPRGETKEFTTPIRGVRQGRGSRTVDLGVLERTEIKAWWYGRPDTLSTDGYDLLIARAIDENAVSSIVEIANDMKLEARSLGAILELANRVLTILQVLLGSVGALALLVATLGVANTMMMAIYERTREIGILKAIGATNQEVRRMFTADAVLLGLIGGFVGVILGTLLGRLVDWAGHQYLTSEGVTGIGQMSIVPPWLAIGALIFAGFIGVIGGIYPATRAARLDPVEALRHE
jgi:ABC-type lipoprotein export system ATPase subunit/ABC-type lipoprotein release transport system permease subunit